VSKRWILLVLVVVLALAACGDDSSPFVAPDSGGSVTTGGDGQGTTPTTSGGGDGDPTTAPPTTAGELTGPGEIALSQAISDELLAGASDLGGDLGVLGPAEATCIGDGVVSALGTVRLRELGLRPGGMDESADLFGDMTQQELLAVTNVALDCIDVRGLLVELLGEVGIGAGSANCVADELLDSGVLSGLLESVVAASGSDGAGLEALGEDPAIMGTLIRIFRTCLTDEEMGTLLGGLGGDF